jgi:hypothetical protein
MSPQKIRHLFAQCVGVKDQGAYVGFAFVVYDQKAFARHSRIGVDVCQNANFTPNSLKIFISGACPDGRPVFHSPITHQWMVAEHHVNITYTLIGNVNQIISRANRRRRGAEKVRWPFFSVRKVLEKNTVGRPLQEEVPLFNLLQSFRFEVPPHDY